MVGGYVLTKDDIVEGRMFDDAIARGGRALNVHAEYGGDSGHWVESKEGKAYGIPDRCLVPRDVDNLLVAGRIISVDHMALGSVRGIPLCIATGQAAGTAAALAAKAGVQVRDVDVQLGCARRCSPRAPTSAPEVAHLLVASAQSHADSE